MRPIAQLNKLKSLNQVRAGERIFIPIQGLKKAQSADAQLRSDPLVEQKKYHYIFFHEVSETDTIYRIAQKYQVENMINIYRWNNLKSYNSIRPGMLLMLKE